MERNDGSTAMLTPKDGAAPERKSVSFITYQEWYNRVSHADYSLLLNWVNNCPKIAWNNGMDLSQQQAIAPPSTGNNNNITENLYCFYLCRRIDPFG